MFVCYYFGDVWKLGNFFGSVCGIVFYYDDVGFWLIMMYVVNDLMIFGVVFICYGVCVYDIDVGLFFCFGSVEIDFFQFFVNELCFVLIDFVIKCGCFQFCYIGEF